MEVFTKLKKKLTITGGGTEGPVERVLAPDGKGVGLRVEHPLVQRDEGRVREDQVQVLQTAWEKR